MAAPMGITAAPMISQRSGRAPFEKPQPADGGRNVDTAIGSIGTSRVVGIKRALAMRSYPRIMRLGAVTAGCVRRSGCYVGRGLACGSL